MIYFDDIHYLFAFKITLNAGSNKEMEASEEGCGATGPATQGDKTKLPLSGPPRCPHIMLMSWGPLSVGALQPEPEECVNHAWTCSSLGRNRGKCV